MDLAKRESPSLHLQSAERGESSQSINRLFSGSKSGVDRISKFVSRSMGGGCAGAIRVSATEMDGKHHLLCLQGNNVNSNSVGWI